jgi:hypothetical protein
VVIVGSASGVVGMGGEVADRARLVGAVRAAAARCGRRCGRGTGRCTAVRIAATARCSTSRSSSLPGVKAVAYSGISVA